MYLKKITIKNVKSFAHLEIDFSEGEDICLWTTLFGENGLGKSTLLQAIGVALAGPSAMRELLPVAEGWVRREEPYGEIIAELMWTDGDAVQSIPKSGRAKKKTPYVARYIVTGENPELLPESLPESYSYSVPTIVTWSGDGDKKQRENLTKDKKRLQKTAYAESKTGWLACGYGPFRRLSGGAQEADQILYAERIAARFVTLFREDAALTSTTKWLIDLHNTAREGDKNSEQALKQVKSAFTTKLFPESVELEVDARKVHLQISGQKSILLRDLSDGYRSMIALSIDLLRWLIKAFPDSDNPMYCPGVVLIDELDAHLHPKWQKQIGYWLREKFPKIQFIIATHSPFLAQIADLGSNIVLKQTDNGVVAHSDVESVENLRIEQIYQSELFNMDSLYSQKTDGKLKRHQDLYRKKNSTQLSKEEEEEYNQLNLWRENIPMLTNPMERRVEKTLQNLINQQRDKLKDIS